MIRRLSILIACIASPALADIPTIDRTVLNEREDRDRKTAEIEEVDNGRYVNSQSVTCSMYRPARKDDPLGAANANPAIAGLVRRIAREEKSTRTSSWRSSIRKAGSILARSHLQGRSVWPNSCPGLLRDLGVDPYNIEQNLRGGARYYKQQLRRYGGNVSLALAAYNAGHGNVQKYGGVPPFRETQGYVANITQQVASGVWRFRQVRHPAQLWRWRRL